MSDWPDLAGLIVCDAQPDSGALYIAVDGRNPLAQAEPLEQLYPLAVGHGLIHWEFDLRPAPLLQSRVVGAIVGLNTRLMLRQGSLTLVVAPESHTARMLMLLKLERLLAIVERPQEEAPLDPPPPPPAPPAEPDGLL